MSHIQPINKHLLKATLFKQYQMQIFLCELLSNVLHKQILMKILYSISMAISQLSYFPHYKYLKCFFMIKSVHKIYRNYLKKYCSVLCIFFSFTPTNHCSLPLPIFCAVNVSLLRSYYNVQILAHNKVRKMLFTKYLKK